ncbi:hypothetical protein [Mesorhizobium sp. M8A.F.Ca.ET.182.01.1.1]|nr:hypothetical protein [Mesorhizobium sp. M8A.F.Ca.ET.182.01.1.1]
MEPTPVYAGRDGSVLGSSASSASSGSEVESGHVVACWKAAG